MSRFILLLTLAFSSCTSTVYLVRHAEKSGPEATAGLTQAGQARAQVLAQLLARKHIREIWSTPYNRTLLTAEPLRQKTGLTVQYYQGLDSVAMMVKKAGKNALIVGHSNTTPEVIRKLGATPSMQLIPDSVYNRLFIVKLPKGVKGKVRLEESTY